MNISHNELVVVCSKAFESLHKYHGEADIIANMVVDLEMVGLHGVDHFINALTLLSHEQDAPVDITAETAQHITVDLHGYSILCHLPILIDYALEKLATQSQIILNIEQCHSRWLAFSELIKLAKIDLSVRAYWFNPMTSHHVLYILNAGQILPELYFYHTTQLPITGTQINPLHGLYIEINKQPISLPTPSMIIQHLASTTLLTAKKNTWQHGITISPLAWKTIKQFAKTALVAPNEHLQPLTGIIKSK